MNMRKYTVVFLAVALLLSALGTVSAQNEYSDVIIDEEGDVSYFRPNDPFPIQVEKPNADIIQVELSSEGSTVSVSLTVLGEILDHQDDDNVSISYRIWFQDEDGTGYFIQSDGYETFFTADGYPYETKETTGIGTDTLSVSFSAEEIGEPATLELTDAEIWMTVEDDEGVHTYRDTATAEDDEEDEEDPVEFEPVNFELNIEPTTGEAPLDVLITVSADNEGETDGEIPVMTDDQIEPIYILEVPAESSAEESFDHTFYEEDVYSISFGYLSETVIVTGDEDDDPPEDEYSDVITDPEDDVMRATGEGEEDWEFVENPDIDIIRVEISESDGIVTVSLTVKGTIRDHPDFIYQIYMKDGYDGTYDIEYSDGESSLTIHELYSADVAIDGVGTDTLDVVFVREQINNPGELLISKVETYNEGMGEVDMAGPDAEYPPGYDDFVDPDDPDDPDDNGDDDETSMFLWIMPIVAVIVIALVLVIFLMKKKGDREEPPQEPPYEQPQEQPPYEQHQQQDQTENTPPPPRSD